MALSRRSFIQHACAASCACGASLVSATRAAAKNLQERRLLARDAVQLTDSPLLRQFSDQQRLYLAIDDDALLKPFRQRAGQAAPGADMGGWYDDSKDFLIDPKDWSTANWHGFIPGHSFGQYVSGLARGYAATRDAGTRRKVSALVGKYAETISPRFFDDYNLPAYTFDKLVVGLIDAHQYAGVHGAREALAKLTDSVQPFLPEKALTREERRARPHKREAEIWDEPYTLPENLFLASKLGLGARYGAMAKRYLQDDALFDPLAEGRSPFKGKHAYSHVNALSSAIEAWRATGNEKYLKAAKNGFDFVEAQSYATGGWGPNEELLAADDAATLYSMLSDTQRSFETPCGAYAHFKIARSLLLITGDPRYGDSMERVLYNTILGALPTLPNGDTFYYSDYSATARKVYRPEKWPCCSGTFVQLTADYGISSYFVDGDALCVNLYSISRATAELNGQRVSLAQHTAYPNQNSIQFIIQVGKPARFGLKFRIPRWTGPGTRLKKNGADLKLPISPGTFLELEGMWKHGDILELEFDMGGMRLEPLNAAHPEMVALLAGPRVLFPVEAVDEPLTRAELLAARPRGGDEWTAKTASGDLVLRPFAAISGESYRLYSRVRA